ncbi:MAG TPA: UDP-glucose 4-epimerase GalE [Myxococcota bacterium]|nr:UDP-glucose 4-epimerase GalE [Myxococcota bacterium]
MARLLVTGGAGYIGSHALRALLRAGHEAVVIDDLRAGRAEFVQGAPLVVADAGDRAALARLFREHGPIDGVLHFAASLSVAESVAKPMLYYRNNVAGSANLIAECLAHGVRAFVLSSSAATYGHPEQQPIVETTPQQPINPYGASKWMVERMLADASRAHGLRWAALRYFNACGADPDGGLGECHEPEIHLIPVALEAAAGLRPKLQLYGTDYPTPDGTCVRDYIHVTDLADAHLRSIEALSSGRAGGGFNLGTGIGRSNREVIEGIGRAIGRPVPFEEAPRRPGDPPVLVADASRFMRELDWRPRYSQLDTIVRTAWAWLRSWKGIR